MSGKAEYSALQEKVKSLQASEQQHQETTVSLRCDIDNLTRKLRRAKKDIEELEKSVEDLEQRNRDLLIARNKSENVINQYRSKLDASESALQSELTSSNTSNINGQHHNSSSNNAQKLVLNPHKWPAGCVLGPFGVPTAVDDGVICFLEKNHNDGKHHWSTEIPNAPQKWVFEEYPNAVYLPIMSVELRQYYENAGLKKLKVKDLKDVLRDLSLTVSGNKNQLISRVQTHLNGIYDEQTAVENKN